MQTYDGIRRRSVRHSAILNLVVLLCVGSAMAQNVVYKTNFNRLEIGTTQPFPGLEAQDYWFNVAVAGGYGDIQSDFALGRNAIHEGSPATDPVGAQTIDRRRIDPPDLRRFPIVTLKVDFLCRTTDYWAINPFVANFSVTGGPHPGFEIIGFNIGGGNGQERFVSGLGVVIYSYNAQDQNNVDVPLSVGQGLTWDQWHTLTLVIDKENDTYVSISVDDEEQSLLGRPPTRNVDGGVWTTGWLMEQINAQVVAFPWPGSATEDDMYWDNISLTVLPRPVVGDVNGDGCVDDADLTLLILNFGSGC